MKQRSGDKSLVSHVAGEDPYGHFTVGKVPKDRLQDEDFDLCRADVAIKSRVLYEGAQQEGGKRYRQER